MATYSEYKTLVKEEVQMYVAQYSSKDKEDFSSKKDFIQLVVYLYYAEEKTNLYRYAHDLSGDEYYQGEIMIGISDLYDKDFYIRFEAAKQENEDIFVTIEEDTKAIEKQSLEITCTYFDRINKKIPIQFTKNNQENFEITRVRLEQWFDPVLSSREKKYFIQACNRAGIEENLFSIKRPHPYASNWIVTAYQQGETLSIFKHNLQKHVQPMRCQYRSALFSYTDVIHVWTSAQPDDPLFTFRVIRHE